MLGFLLLDDLGAEEGANVLGCFDRLHVYKGIRVLEHLVKTINLEPLT